MVTAEALGVKGLTRERVEQKLPNEHHCLSREQADVDEVARE